MWVHFFKSVIKSISDFCANTKFEEISSKYTMGWGLSSKLDFSKGSKMVKKCEKKVKNFISDICEKK